MSARYVVLPRADRDLDDQAEYFAAESGIELGLRFLAAARETFSLLSGHQQMGWKCQLRNPTLADTRLFRVSGFENILIFYRIFYRTGRDCIEIIRVLHGTRDLEKLFVRDE